MDMHRPHALTSADEEASVLTLNRWERKRDCARSPRRKADARRGEVSGRDVQRRDAGGWARREHASTAAG